MKWTAVALIVAAFGAVACQAGAAKSPSPAPSPTAPTPSESRLPSTPAPTVEHQPLPLDRIGEALIDTSDLPYPASIWSQEDGNGGNIWDNGLCGKAAGPTPMSRVARRFVSDQSSYYAGGWVIETIMVFAPGDAAKFMDALRASADPCNAELTASGRTLNRPRLPQIRNESQSFTVESFQVHTPLPTDSQQPHDIVYIRDGDVVLHVYASVDVVEPAARHAEDRLDGVPIRPN